MSHSSIFSSNRFFTAFLKTSILIVAVAWGLYALCVPEAGKHERMRQQEFARRASTLTALSLGTSHNVGLHFQSMGLNGFSLYMGFSDMREVEFRLANVVHRLPMLEYVFVPVLPGSLELANDRRDLARAKRLASGTPGINLISRLPLSAGLYDVLNHVLPVDELLWSRNRVKLWLSSWSSKAVESPCRPEPNPEFIGMEDGLPQGYLRYPLPRDCFTSSAMQRAQEIAAALPDESLTKVRQRNVDNIKRIANILAQKRVSLILYAPPIMDEFARTSLFSEFHSDFRNAMEVLQHEPNIQFHDFHDFFNVGVGSQNQYFFDADHLTLFGAREFSIALRAALD